MSVILVSKEMTNGRALVHYRVGGEKKGVRRYQYKDGSLTPEGYQHYKEMYGWGDRANRKSGSGSGDDKEKPIVSRKEYKSILKTTKKDDKEFREEWDYALSKAKSSAEKDAVNKEYYEIAAGMAESRAVLEKNAGHPDLAKKYREESERLRSGNISKSTLVRFREQMDARAEKNKPETRKEEKASEREIEEKVTEGMKTANQKIQDKAAERRQKQKELMDKIRSIRSMPDDELNKNINRLQREKQLADLINERAAREKGPMRQIMDKAFRQAVENLTKRSMDMVVDTMVNKAKTKLVGRKPEETGTKTDTSTSTSTSGGGKLSKDQKRQVRSLAASGKTAAELAVQFGVSESYINVLISSS